LKKNGETSSDLNDRRRRAIPVAVLLIFVVLLSMGSGFYASASFFAQQSPNVTVTTTIYTTTTSWTTSTIWSTVTSVVQGVLTTVAYVTSTSTVTVTSSSTSSSPVTQVATTITMTSLVLTKTSLSVSGSLVDATGRPVQSASVGIYVNGALMGTVVTGSAGTYSYSTGGIFSRSTYTITVVFQGTPSYGSSQASKTVGV